MALVPGISAIKAPLECPLGLIPEVKRGGGEQPAAGIGVKLITDLSGSLAAEDSRIHVCDGLPPSVLR